MSGIHSSTQMLWPTLFVARLRLPLACTSPSLSGSIHCTCRTSLVDSKHRTMSRYSAPSKLIVKQTHGDVGSLPSAVNHKNHKWFYLMVLWPSLLLINSSMEYITTAISQAGEKNVTIPRNTCTQPQWDRFAWMEVWSHDTLMSAYARHQNFH